MELWSFINKETKNIIRFSLIYTTDEDFGIEYFFVENDSFPMWFVESEMDAINAFQEFVHPQYRMYYKTPSTNRININDYEIKKIN